jgi:hypothetical protein
MEANQLKRVAVRPEHKGVREHEASRKGHYIQVQGAISGYGQPCDGHG